MSSPIPPPKIFCPPDCTKVVPSSLIVAVFHHTVPCVVEYHRSCFLLICIAAAEEGAWQIRSSWHDSALKVLNDLYYSNVKVDSFPASDKSFSKLLGEVPLLPESALKVLNDLCYSDVIDHHGKIV
ncbi:symplekin tight junction protein carboxy-terminal protein [Senna tora]|uniref:Symplekin tight junction protein carboxy-terminal protein n=1 Tax=Senna tora TaxID=362788 RepID=A0A834T9N5_9FABA|nr:symplekin tight junction protein carboxy-terminal protein [Senna tora]